MVTIRVVFAVAGLLSVMCRRTAVFKPHRDVSTPQGTVRGFLSPTHAAYYGIPYARSPTQSDRFKAPEPPPTWDGIFEASHKIKCPQQDEQADENCLVINVFAPRRSTVLPVYVLVHDGDFKSGWGAYDPPARLLREGFVVVTFNYRLGALGFLSLGTPEALGNAGLKDQVAALYWINKNIDQFGGNPDEVIVHGIGSGSVSIQLLLLSGLVEGLVHKAILESGSILSPLSMTYDPVSIAYQGATTIGYTGEMDVEQLYTFYLEAKWQDIVQIQETFLPCVEGENNLHSLINFDPIHGLMEANYNKIPVMITYTNTISDNNSTDADNSISLSENEALLLPSNLEFDNDKTRERLSIIVKEFYFGTDSIETDIPQNFFDHNYDVYVEYPIVKMAMLYALHSPYMVYLMKFAVDHTSPDDSSVISFGSILDNLYRDRGDEDIVLGKLITLWINFIKLGDPTPLTTSLIPVIWQPVVIDSSDSSAIATIPTFIFDNKLKMRSHQKIQRLMFWENIYRRFYKPYVIKKLKSEDLDDND